MLQNIINFVSGNLWLIFIIGAGLFNVSIRVAQKMKEQRELRAVQAQIKKQRQEELRTGRPATPNPQQQRAQAAIPAKSAQEQRQERVAEMRKVREAKLKALQEQAQNALSGQSQTSSVSTGPSKTAGGLADVLVVDEAEFDRLTQRDPSDRSGESRRAGQRSSPAAQSSNRQTGNRSGQQPGQQVGQQATRQPRQGQPTQTSSSRSASQSSNQAYSQSASSNARRRASAQSQKSTKSSSTPSANNASVHRPTRAASTEHERKIGQIETFGNRKTRTKRSSQSSPMTAKSLLRNKDSIRQAIIINEILDKPIGLRDDEISSKSLF